MNESFVDKNLIKIKYEDPLDVAKLFGRYRLAYTLNHIFATFLDETNSGRNSKINYLEPIVFNRTHNVFLVEYSFLIDTLSELVDDKTIFNLNFKLNFDDTKNSMFLIVSLLEEYLKIVKINSKKMKCANKNEIIYRPSFVTQTIIYYVDLNTESDSFIQMNAVVFSVFELQKLLDKKIFNALIESFKESVFSQHDKIFGRKACESFWKNHKKTAFFYRD